MGQIGMAPPRFGANSRPHMQIAPRLRARLRFGALCTLEFGATSRIMGWMRPSLGGCGRQGVDAAVTGWMRPSRGGCVRHGVDAAVTGWMRPYRARRARRRPRGCSRLGDFRRLAPGWDG